MADEYAKRTLDFVEDIQKLHGYDDVCRRVTAELEWFGYTHVTVWSLPGPGSGLHDGVLLNTRPEDYNEHYARENLIAKDPVILALRRNVVPFSWSDIKDQVMSKAARRILEEAVDFGARDGLVIPILTASGSLALFSPCGHSPNLTPRARSALEMIGIYSHHALQRALVQVSRDKAPAEALTQREREVLTWVAAGETDDEIGIILNLGRTTVLTHVENAKRKLDATTRTYAVVQALRSGEINL